MTAPGYIPPDVPGWWVKNNRVVFAPAATLTLTGSAPTLHSVLRPPGGSLTLTGSAPTVATAGAVTYISSASASASTVTMPTHASGDLLLMWAYRPLSTTPASLPAGWTNVINGGSNTSSGRVGYKIAASSGETSGTWTNAQMLIVMVYRNASGVGASARTSGNSSTHNVPGLTLNVTTGTSRVVTFASTSTTGGAYPSTTDNGFSRRLQLEGAGEDGGAYDTGGATTSFDPDTINYGSADTFQTAAVEILD